MIGLFFNPGSSPIAYVNDFLTPATLQIRDIDVSIFTPGVTISFDTLVFPFDFLVSANVFVGANWMATHQSNGSFIDCPLLDSQQGAVEFFTFPLLLIITE